jgi:hypothetical protein
MLTVCVRQFGRPLALSEFPALDLAGQLLHDGRLRMYWHDFTSTEVWSFNTHRVFPLAFQRQVFTLLCCHARKDTPPLCKLPKDVLYVVIRFLGAASYDWEENAVEEYELQMLDL